MENQPSPVSAALYFYTKTIRVFGNVMTTHDHEFVSIYGFDKQQTDQFMSQAGGWVLMWATQYGWPVGVTHSFVWRDGRGWITFAAHRRRATAIQQNQAGSATTKKLLA